MRRCLPALTVLTVPALMLVLSACGSASTTGSQPAASTSPGPAMSTGHALPADLETYRQCLAQYGVTLPEVGPGDRDDSNLRRPMDDDSMPMATGSMDPNNPPTIGAPGDHPAPPGVDPQAWAAAEAACGDLGEVMGRPGERHGPEGQGHGPEGQRSDGDRDGDRGQDHDGPDDDAVSLPPVPGASG